MSLLNEALRKNKSENSRKIIFEIPSQVNQKPKRSTLIIISVLVLLTTVFLLAWINLGKESNKSVAVKHAAPADEFPEELNAPEPALLNPVIPEEVRKEPEKNADIPVKEVISRVSVKKNEPVTVPLITEVSEVRKSRKKEEKTPGKPKAETADDERSHYAKAVQFHKQGKLENAVWMYRKVLSYNPENSDALFNLASIYISLSRYQDAFNILTGLLSGNPADSETLLNLAIAEIGLGKNREALSHLEGIDEGDGELQFRVAFHKGVALSRLGEQTEALVCYRNAEMLINDYPALLFNMAILYDKLGNYDKAIDYYLKLINSDSSDIREKDKFKQRIKALQDSVSSFTVKNSS